MINSLEFIQSIHEQTLQIALQNTKDTDDYYHFALRQNNNQKKLESGYWFHGSDRYLFFSTYSRADSNSKTKSIGLVVKYKNNKIKTINYALNFSGPENECVRGVFLKLAALLNISADPLKFRGESPCSTLNWEKELKHFLTEICPKINEIIRAANLDDLFFIGEEKFDKAMSRIYKIKEHGLYNPEDEAAKEATPLTHTLTPSEYYNFVDALAGNPIKTLSGKKQLVIKNNPNRNGVSFYRDGDLKRSLNNLQIMELVAACNQSLLQKGKLPPSSDLHNWSYALSVVKAMLSNETEPQAFNLNPAIEERDEIEKLLAMTDLKGANRETVVKTRVGQGKFRELLKVVWSNKCAVTGCDITDILIASHIKPWAESNENEKVDPYNGLLLTPNLDKLFDQYMISFDDDGVIMIPESISNYSKIQLGIRNGMKIVGLSEQHKLYLKAHRLKFNKHHG